MCVIVILRIVCCLAFVVGRDHHDDNGGEGDGDGDDDEVE